MVSLIVKGVVILNVPDMDFSNNRIKFFAILFTGTEWTEISFCTG